MTPNGLLKLVDQSLRSLISWTAGIQWPLMWRKVIEYTKWEDNSPSTSGLLEIRINWWDFTM